MVLPIVITFALGAVLMLTGTLLAAQEIEERVDLITNQTTDIDDDLDAVRLAKRTRRISERILTQVKPLDEELRRVVAAAQDIDATATSILLTARSINNRVLSINAAVESILATAKSIEATVASIEGEATSIDATAGSIRSRLAAVLGEAFSIDRGVAGINRRAERVIRRVSPIEEDVDAISEQVGRGEVSGQRAHRNSIHGHANSIDCSRVVDPPTDGDDASQYCNE